MHTHQQINTQVVAKGEQKATYTSHHHGYHYQMFCLQSTSNKSLMRYSSKPTQAEEPNQLKQLYYLLFFL
jgi:hypothetical protein